METQCVTSSATTMLPSQKGPGASKKPRRSNQNHGFNTCETDQKPEGRDLKPLTHQRPSSAIVADRRNLQHLQGCQGQGRTRSNTIRHDSSATVEPQREPVVIGYWGLSLTGAHLSRASLIDNNNPTAMRRQKPQTKNPKRPERNP